MMQRSSVTRANFDLADPTLRIGRIHFGIELHDDLVVEAAALAGRGFDVEVAGARYTWEGDIPIPGGIGLVQLMGRHSGFIACYAAPVLLFAYAALTRLDPALASSIFLTTATDVVTASDGIGVPGGGISGLP